MFTCTLGSPKRAWVLNGEMAESSDGGLSLQEQKEQAVEFTVTCQIQAYNILQGSIGWTTGQ